MIDNKFYDSMFLSVYVPSDPQAPRMVRFFLHENP